MLYAPVHQLPKYTIPNIIYNVYSESFNYTTVFRVLQSQNQGTAGVDYEVVATLLQGL